MDFIQDQCAAEPCVLDLNYALRVCTKAKKSRACVFLYSAMKMHKEGVAAALQVIFLKHLSNPSEGCILYLLVWVCFVTRLHLCCLPSS
jgi:hypothetical protein